MFFFLVLFCFVFACIIIIASFFICFLFLVLHARYYDIVFFSWLFFWISFSSCDILSSIFYVLFLCFILTFISCRMFFFYFFYSLFDIFVISSLFNSACVITAFINFLILLYLYSKLYFFSLLVFALVLCCSLLLLSVPVLVLLFSFINYLRLITIIQLIAVLIFLFRSFAFVYHFLRVFSNIFFS